MGMRRKRLVESRNGAIERIGAFPYRQGRVREWTGMIAEVMESIGMDGVGFIDDDYSLMPWMET